MELPITGTENRKIHISKLLDAPIEQVWKAWTDPEQIVHWWAPKGFTTTIHKMKVKEGEEWLQTIHGPDRKNYPNKAIFREVIPYKKNVYEHFNPDFVSTTIFEAIANKILIDWTMLFDTVELYEIIVKTFKADKGQKQNIEKLETYLSQKMQ